ncbi:MAG TPA: Asp-tRNA(Asn)/Glu-tRNA(Gln) amidotransferase subunit GatC [Bryobacteraceae bacterium]|nr:Asp-tRNA(Asn)/Glu-tRNA(Gln) amidotransferase subunit GatC [Bryobacteraceae bacterium]
MKITEQQVRTVAELANLRLSNDEVARMQHDLDEILQHVAAMDELDTSNVEPMAQVLFDHDENAAMRPDQEHRPLGSEAAVQNAPMSGGGFFKVPLVIER